MACPFSALRTRQASVASEAHNWAIEEDACEDDSLTLKHLNAAIQLLTVPSVSKNKRKLVENRLIFIIFELVKKEIT